LEPETPQAALPADGLLAHVAGPLLERLVELHRRAGQRKPVLLINGPVGAGKSTLVRDLACRAPAHGLRLAVASIDDAYRPLAERLERLAGNPFGVTRVPPGSHDVDLLVDRIGAWRGGASLRLPRFDKTLAGGQGDRSGDQEEWADALVLEGWLMGCRPLGEGAAAAALDTLDNWDLSEAERQWLPRWDRELQAYERLWSLSDGLWVLRPRCWSQVRRWRFQAEARQRRAGGAWLEPRELERLVRSSLHALPPPLYQDPLVAGFAERSKPVQAKQGCNDPSGGLCSSGGHSRPGDVLLLGVSQLDGRRRWEPMELADQPSSLSSSSAIG
jgi:D-glycerate 3-kinase